VTGERSQPGSGGRRPATEARAPETVEEALALAGQHGRAAAAELLAAARALLDAAALVTRGEPSDAHPWLGRPARVLDDLVRQLDRGEVVAESLLAAVAEALDVEIERWEARARKDADARAVLRAFLGLREVLWEFGVRPGAAPPQKRETSGPRPGRARKRPGGSRVQRVQVDS
jgi:hypothetical protein